MDHRNHDGWRPIPHDAPLGDWIVAYRDGAARMFAIGFFDGEVWRLTDWGNEIFNPESIHPIPG